MSQENPWQRLAVFTPQASGGQPSTSAAPIEQNPPPVDAIHPTGSQMRVPVMHCRPMAIGSDPQHPGEQRQFFMDQANGGLFGVQTPEASRSQPWRGDSDIAHGRIPRRLNFDESETGTGQSWGNASYFSDVSSTGNSGENPEAVYARKPKVTVTLEDYQALKNESAEARKTNEKMKVLEQQVAQMQAAFLNLTAGRSPLNLMTGSGLKPEEAPNRTSSPVESPDNSKFNVGANRANVFLQEIGARDGQVPPLLSPATQNAGQRAGEVPWARAPVSPEEPGSQRTVEPVSGRGVAAVQNPQTTAEINPNRINPLESETVQPVTVAVPPQTAAPTTTTSAGQVGHPRDLPWSQNPRSVAGQSQGPAAGGALPPLGQGFGNGGQGQGPVPVGPALFSQMRQSPPSYGGPIGGARGVQTQQGDGRGVEYGRNSGEVKQPKPEGPPTYDSRQRNEEPASSYAYVPEGFNPPGVPASYGGSRGVPEQQWTRTIGRDQFQPSPEVLGRPQEAVYPTGRGDVGEGAPTWPPPGAVGGPPVWYENGSDYVPEKPAEENPVYLGGNDWRYTHPETGQAYRDWEQSNYRQKNEENRMGREPRATPSKPRSAMRPSVSLHRPTHSSDEEDPRSAGDREKRSRSQSGRKKDEVSPARRRPRVDFRLDEDDSTLDNSQGEDSGGDTLLEIKPKAFSGGPNEKQTWTHFLRHFKQFMASKRLSSEEKHGSSWMKNLVFFLEGQAAEAYDTAEKEAKDFGDLISRMTPLVETKIDTRVASQQLQTLTKSSDENWYQLRSKAT